MTEYPRPPGSGRLIAFEGGEGAGKTTHSRLPLNRLQAAGCPARHVREPAGTPLGEYLRAYLKSDRPLGPQAELMRFGAARAELFQTVIRPALARQAIVVADRGAASSHAYQGAGSGLDRRLIQTLNRFAAGDRRPDLTILLNVPPELGLRRTAQQHSFTVDLQENAVPQTANQTGRRFDDLPLAVHRQINAAFRAMAESDPSSWDVVDAAQDLDAVADAVWQTIQERFALNRPQSEPEPAPLLA